MAKKNHLFVCLLRLYFGIMDVDQYNHFDADDGHSKTIMDGPSIFQIQKTNKTKCRVVVNGGKVG